MNDISNKIKSLFSQDDSVLNENQNMGGVTGFARDIVDKAHAYRRKDARRKRVERQGEQRLNGTKNKKVQEDEEIDPRSVLTNEMRFTLKECFLVQLVEYLETGKQSYVHEAIKLMEEYPKLKTWVMETSHKQLPGQPFSLYSLKEWFSEEVGHESERIGEHPHIWSLSERGLDHKMHGFDDAMVIECRVSPDKVLIYIPAFTQMMEELLLSGKIMETVGNPLRKAKQYNECITDNSVNKGLIVKIHNKGN